MNHIILIGFMGSGKSTLGRRLSKKMKLNFVDTDDLVEEQTGQKISELFAQKGEAYFRQKETEALQSLLLRQERCVIACGGGLPVQIPNQPLLKQLGTVVYLQAQIDTLMERLQNDTKRPKLQGGDLRVKIETLMKQRKDLYEQAADCFVSTDHRSYDAILQEIQKKCGKSAEDSADMIKNS